MTETARVDSPELRGTEDPHAAEAGRGRGRLGLVTGATGYVGGEVVARLLEEGWRVRVLTRHRSSLDDVPWRRFVQDGNEAAAPGQVEVVEGDATARADLERALAGVDTAWYLLHSMGDVDDFRAAERDMAEKFATAAAAAKLRRIVYLGGLHPEGELSEHLESRVEVGRILMRSGVPTAALQAGIVIGDGSASFAMLRGLAERLPGAFGPSWLRNRITPIAIRDLRHYLVRAADLAPSVNRTFDVGGSDTVPYADLLGMYAATVGLGPRPVLTLPVLTPQAASVWIALVTNVPRDLVEPIVESILHETVVKERDLDELVGSPPGGHASFAEAVRDATRDIDPKAWRRTLLRVSGAVALTGIIGALATNPKSIWYRSLAKPVIQPPAAVFPLVWNALYADIAVTSALTLADERERAAAGEDRARSRLRGMVFALGGNLIFNAGWSAVFFRGHRLGLSTGVAAALALSSADLVRRAGRTGPSRGVLLAPYVAWTAFATVLTGAIWQKNSRRGETLRRLRLPRAFRISTR